MHVELVVAAKVTESRWDSLETRIIIMSILASSGDGRVRTI
jgi:hypothetical protein